MESESLEDLRAQLKKKFRLQSHYEVKYSNAEIIGTCMVCDLAIVSSELIIECPSCHNKAHQAHLLEWVKIRGECPECGSHISRHDLE